MAGPADRAAGASHGSHSLAGGVGVLRPREERRALAHAIEAQERWIFEGGFSTTYASRIARADTLIWLDLPVWRRLCRVASRHLRYWGKQREDMAEGCHEGIHEGAFSFYVWIWQTRHTGREQIANLLSTARADLTVHHCKSPAEVSRLQTQIANPRF